MNKKLIKNILFILTISIFLSALFASKALSEAQQIYKKLNMSDKTSHLFTFNEKIIRYKFGNEKNFKAEVLSNIFNTRQELLVKPLKSQNDKLTVWTEFKIYNIDFEFDQNQKLKIRETPENALLKDKPAVLSEDTSGMSDFELDNPPKINKKIN